MIIPEVSPFLITFGTSLLIYSIGVVWVKLFHLAAPKKRIIQPGEANKQVNISHSHDAKSTEYPIYMLPCNEIIQGCIVPFDERYRCRSKQ